MHDDQRDAERHATTRAVVGTIAFLLACVLFLSFGQVALLKELLIYLVLIGGGVGIGSRYLPNRGLDGG